MKHFLLLTALLALTATATATAQPHHNPRIIQDSIYSSILQCHREFTVLLPPGFHHNPTAQYPILYLLHGMYDDNRSWTNKGRLQDVADLLYANGEATEMVIVTPNAGGVDVHKQQNGYFDLDNWAYEQFFFNEFMPQIEKRFRIISDRNHRAIAGLSMGGGGATSYGQRHTDTFCAVYAMSALMDIPAGSEMLNADPDDKVAKLTRSVMRLSCTNLVRNADEQTLQQLRTVSWFIDCGDDDFLLDRNIEFYQAMRAAHIPCQFRVRDGGHVWQYWHTALYTCLPFVSRCFTPAK